MPDVQVSVHGRNHTVTASLKDFAEEKLGHLKKYLSTIQEIHVEVERDGHSKHGDNHVVHVTVSTAGPVFRSKVSAPTARAAIDIAYERLERRVKEFKRMRSGKPAHARGRVRSPDVRKPDTSEETEQ